MTDVADAVVHAFPHAGLRAMPDDVVIHPVSDGLGPEAIALLTRTFAAGPMHVETFGADSEPQREAYFRAALSSPAGRKLEARQNGRVVGVAYWTRSPECCDRSAGRAWVTPRMIRELGMVKTAKVAAWKAACARHHPSVTHAHLGVIAVDPDARGQQVGQRLMDLYLGECDLTNTMGYLETDRPEHVAYFEQYGFVLSSQCKVAGIDHFFMRRAPIHA